MKPLPPDFREFLALLNKHNVKYLLIGGYAVAFYGFIRATNDMDIWIFINPENARKIYNTLIEFGFNVPGLTDDLFLKEHQVIRMGVPPLRLEILTTISGVTFEECYKNRVIETIEGLEINIINLEHLKINKKASGRLKDLNDLENLL
ncbi:MAG: hypothetical protein HY738_12245 [Bacteroidia bacterium]|nr:hypothetical protein [Bacteroidia bacterium]